MAKPQFSRTEMIAASVISFILSILLFITIDAFYKHQLEAGTQMAIAVVAACWLLYLLLHPEGY